MEGMAIVALMFSGALALYAAYVMRKANEYVRLANKSNERMKNQFDGLLSDYNALIKTHLRVRPARAPNGRFVKRS